jgi:hypothetical protein
LLPDHNELAARLAPVVRHFIAHPFIENFIENPIKNPKTLG